MKKLLYFLVFVGFLSVPSTYSQAAGRIVVNKFLAPSIEGNRGGENPLRQISVYLPPGYDDSTKKYPTIYFLHGFNSSDTEMFEWMKLKQLMDEAIKSGILRPTILVLPNSNTLFRGSFYTNSIITGNWADFIGKDVVAYIDKNFRTIVDRNSRGLSGHSMGGNGALKIGMLFPEVFGAIYAMSPAVLNWSGDFTIQNSGFKILGESKNEADIIKGIEDFEKTWDEKAFYAAVIVSMARAYSPNENSKYKADFPVSYSNGKPFINLDVIKKWEANFPMNMVENHLPGLKNLVALKIDWGRNEDFSHVPTTALQFSKKLETFGIPHFAEEYIGDHVSNLGGFEGRIYTDLLPFFNAYLKY
ncbi:alpha/beta hydrolase-fold protein [Aequorivita sp. SDUM287046]|uniref:Alpha/beta hydrolase-fold protein n=1 Tax=Aequorivita aurantiaca TaxID=3053356 RepID=A0ABT8DJV7_9FLAO|nr:alpha/beta hydrolase-fold protein [Aequorivita aurantiaca]MDN3723425.1 alpha/beta hydrolase-fold protein [Aequorivita aurantiaca]